MKVRELLAELRKNPALNKKSRRWVLAEHEKYCLGSDIINEGSLNAGKFVIDPGYSKFFNDADEDAGRQLVVINVPNFDAAWRGSNPNQYIGAHGQGSIKGRYERFGKWLLTANEPIEASTVGVDADGSVSFLGRHRYCYLRDHGVKTIKVAMGPTSIKNAKTYGLIR